MNPVITSIGVAPSTIPPGGTSVVTIVGSDPDSRVGRLVGIVRDQQGNQSTADVFVTVSDPITYELQDADGIGFLIVQRAGQPGVFDVRAPA